MQKCLKSWVELLGMNDVVQNDCLVQPLYSSEIQLKKGPPFSLTARLVTNEGYLILMGGGGFSPLNLDQERIRKRRVRIS